MRRIFLIFFIVLFIEVFFVSFFAAQAEGGKVYCEDIEGKVIFSLVPCGRSCDIQNTAWDETADCNICHLVFMLYNIFDFIAFTLAPILAGLFFLIGGFLFLTSGGSEERVSKAKALFKATVIGLIIVYVSWILVNAVINSDFVTDSLPGFTKVKWNEFYCR